jgi:hypothetical protein
MHDQERYHEMQRYEGDRARTILIILAFVLLTALLVASFFLFRPPPIGPMP